MNHVNDHAGPDLNLITRREAIRRTALALGVAVTPSFINAVLHAQPASQSAMTKAPSYLAAKQFETVSAIAERILPKSDTPGANDVGVPGFIDLMYGKYMTDDEKQVFAAGLADAEKASTASGQRAFAQLSPTQQDAVLTTIARAAQDKEKTFFHLMKELTLLGYFTCEAVGKNVLHYDPIPGRYEGCIPLSQVGNVSWTR